MSTTLSGDAYCVLFMHACKHPSRAVNGLLLGKTSEQGVSVQKALPLFHTPLGLAPMLEAALMLVRNSPATPPCAPFCRTHDPCALFCRTPDCALSQADEHCKGQGLQIVGYYQANEMCDDLELGPFGKTIADKIRAQCKQAAVLVVRTGLICFQAYPAHFFTGTRPRRSTGPRCTPRRRTCGSCPSLAARRHRRSPSPRRRSSCWSNV